MPSIYRDMQKTERLLLAVYEDIYAKLKQYRFSIGFKVPYVSITRTELTRVPLGGYTRPFSPPPLLTKKVTSYLKLKLCTYTFYILSFTRPFEPP